MFNNDNDNDSHDNRVANGDLQAKALGILSVASGGAMLVAPHTMARLYALPQKPVALLRAIAVRDFLIGLGLLSPRWRRTAAVARGIADVGDSILIAAHAVSARQRRKRARTHLARTQLSAHRISKLYRAARNRLCMSTAREQLAWRGWRRNTGVEIKVARSVTTLEQMTSNDVEMGTPQR